MTPNDDTKTMLLNAAGEVFAAEGYEAATVRTICRRAGVANIAAVNYYFGDKERLYVAAVKAAFAHRQGVEAMPTWPPGTPAARRFREFVRHFTAGLIGDGRPLWHMQLVGRELSQPSAACAAFVRDFARPHFELLLGIVNDLVAPETAAEDRHLIVLSVIGQCVHHRCARLIIVQVVGEAEARTYTAERLAEHIADFSLAAITHGPHAHKSARRPAKS
jgi:AcrR family transcriptional regulator